MSDIRQAGTQDIAAVTGLLTRAFLHSPVGDWLVPDIVQRHRIYRRYFRIFTEHVATHGVVHLMKDGTGAALWLSYADGIPAGITRYDSRLAQATEDRLDRFLALDETFAKHHPTGPHWYLMFIGVHPRRQGLGVGRRLLDVMHHQIGPAGLPVYLEASNGRNKRFYLANGYVSNGRIDLPDGGPPIWPMHRNPPR